MMTTTKPSKDEVHSMASKVLTPLEYNSCRRNRSPREGPLFGKTLVHDKTSYLLSLFRRFAQLLQLPYGRTGSLQDRRSELADS